MRSIIQLSILPVVSASCASKVMILQTPVVSMKETDSGSIQNLSAPGAVEEKWCSGEEPVL